MSPEQKWQHKLKQLKRREKFVEQKKAIQQETSQNSSCNQHQTLSVNNQHLTQPFTSTTPITSSTQNQHLQASNAESTLPSLQAQSPVAADNSAGSLIRDMLSNSHTRNTTPKSITIDGTTYHATFTYRTAQGSRINNMALVDRGANGGLAGDDMIKMSVSETQKVDVIGINNTILKDLPMGTGAARITTTSVPIIGIFHQYAWLGEGRSIHSSLQIQAFDHEVCDTPRSLGGKCMISTPQGHHIPLAIRNGLPYMNMTKPTEEEMQNLPHVIMTSDDIWDPTTCDEEWDPSDFESYSMDKDSFKDDSKDNFGEELPKYEHDIQPQLQHANSQADCTKDTSNKVQDQHIIKEPTKDIYYPDIISEGTVISPRKILCKELFYVSLKPHFLWPLISRIKAIMKTPSYWSIPEVIIPKRRHFQTRFPAPNIPFKPGWYFSFGNMLNITSYQGILGIHLIMFGNNYNIYKLFITITTELHATSPFFGGGRCVLRASN